MSRTLPKDREKALDRIAEGWGRDATRAHPLCVCGQVYRYDLRPRWFFEGCDENGFPEAMRWGHRWEPVAYQPDECPVHGREAAS